MADILANYVKFLRGTPTNYHKLPQKDADTLYFVAEPDQTVGQLWIGDKLITDHTNPEGIIDHLSELVDVDISGAQTGMVLGFNAETGKWTPMTVSVATEVSVMVGASETEAGVEGLVPAAAAGQQGYFLRGDGTWAPVTAEVDLEGYVTDDELTTALETKVSIVEGYDLVENTEIEKLKTISENAEENFVKSVTSDFSVSTSGELSLNNLSIDKVTGLQDELDGLQESVDNKVDKVIYTVLVEDENGDPVYNEDGSPKTEQIEGSLLSPTDREKLDALVISEDGVEISGTVNASNVEELDTWITNHRDTVAGLYSVADANKLSNIEAGAQKNYITSTTDNFAVTEGELSLVSIEVAQVANLQDALDAKADKTTVETLSGTVGTLQESVNTIVGEIASLREDLTNNYVTIEQYNTDKGIIENSIQWHNINE